ncbi:MAG: SAM-dependent chlorinase/fluorinase [Gammaproteobacteria bacterium]|nr:SAM-dependent chlorinase/fluorinase [Gammaproteobacteria bacterium]MBT8105384.1 SAM-dependent chlorinase/fluorinase [Gammaproteobacteria bacterium]NNF48443.1 SAM-dependent chlorinase/fluorinase [Woeseiaceae bacterium]NNK25398.1 SAM-dependent chlorinase/fluorinase [Woeseiaceae bacterium]NNL64377.1 SAM-dependent chlorinase/fluorinase [Woeseiaceae bacterium]
MQPSGVITITTDFGHKGPFAAIMKGVILDRFPEAKVVDLMHDIPAQWPPEAGFWVSRSYGWFPAGSVHMAIVDPGVGTERDILVVECDDHVFLAPDNGLLAQLIDGHSSARVYKLDSARLGLPEPSATFHGRDIFAPVAAELAAGRITVADVATPTREWTPGWIDNPDVAPGKVSGVVVTVDTFGNLISNIDAELIDGFGEPVADIAGQQVPMHKTYGNVQPGEYLALVNSFGVIEIARAEGSAAQGLGSARGAPLVIRDGYIV